MYGNSVQTASPFNLPAQLQQLQQLGEFLKDLREQKGLSQKEVAERVGVSRRETVAEHEAGVTQPSRKVIVRYAELYGVDVHELRRRQMLGIHDDGVGEQYSPGPLVRALPARARSVVLGFLDRLRRAGASDDELRLFESHLASDRARQLSVERDGLNEDKLIALIDFTFDAIADAVALKSGRRP